MARSLSSLPLLVIPVAIYNLFAIFMLFGADPDTPQMFIHQVLLSIPMLAPHNEWRISVGDLLLLGSLICLFFEIIGSSQSSNATLLNHVLSTFLFIICLVEFLLFRPFGTSAFFLLMTMTVMDVVGGFIITTVAARKDIGFG